MAERGNKRGGKLKIIIPLVLLLLLIAGIYGAGVKYFSTHFFRGTVVNGMQASLLTIDEVEQELTDEVATYTLSVVERDGSIERIKAEALGYYREDSTQTQTLLRAQNQWLWPLKQTQAYVYDVINVTGYDSEKLSSAVAALGALQDMVAPEDAYIKEDSDGFSIVPETEGNALDEAKVHAAVEEAVQVGKTEVNLSEHACYLEPQVLQDDAQLAEELAQLTTYLATNIEIDFDDRTETVDGALVKTWIWKNTEGKYYINETLVAEFVKTLAVKYDTFGGPHDFLTTSKKKISIKGGDYGWVLDEDTEVTELLAAIREGRTGVRSPSYTYAANSRKANDIGTTYVEIDLQAQRMYFYKDGKLLVDTPVVTGNADGQHDTPTGVYALDAHKSPSILRGEDYASEVTYWMPFNGDVGIHDADWRTEFGGEIYKTAGSHGCVNTPLLAAKTIFDNIKIGDPIIVY
ncbi:MAG: L,D-transpeptidase family protein [Lachnospiraceae bacterium]